MKRNDETRMTNDERMTKSEVRSAPADFEGFWAEKDAAVSVVREGEGEAPRFDLEERTARFAEAVVDFAKTIPHSPVNNRLIDQLVGAATSVGANYCEADDAVSKKEFIVNINRCRKEARETKFLLRIIARAEPSLKPRVRLLWQEAKELNLIFSSIVRRTREK